MTATEAAEARPPGLLARVGLAFARWSTRWFPDPLVFALAAIVIVYLIAVAAGESPAETAFQAGKSFWTLAPFTLQMAMVVIGGYVVASAPPVRALIRGLAQAPRSPRGAVAFIAFFSMVSALLSWGLSLIFSAQLARAIARRLPGLDYRAAGAAAYLGLGVTWALGLSSSAAMLMATPSALPASLAKVSGVIPLGQTLFLWQNLVMAGVLTLAAAVIAYASPPGADAATTAADLGVSLDETEPPPAPVETPADRLERSPALTLLVVLMLGFYLARLFATSPQGALAALDLNTYNLIFLTAGLLLHWRPASFLRAVVESVPATAGVLIQFPFYAMIFGMIVGTGLSAKISHLFIAVSTRELYPVLVAAYSSVLGVFIPSGGSKWVIEAPYVLAAAKANGVHLGWVVQVYNAAEALPNLVNPFWMLPLLGILKCRARDLVGYGMLQLILLLPLAYGLCWGLALTLR
jgi:short-chain fatty acids transporter